MVQQKPEVRAATREEWQRLWEIDPSAEYYQSPAWAELWARRTPSAGAAPLRITLSSGADVVIPLVRQVRYGGLVSRLMSNPTGSWSGWLSKTSLSDAEAAEVVRAITPSSGVAIDWRSTPLQHRDTLPVSTVGFSQVVDLRGGSDAVRAKWSKGHKAAYKQGLREGVQVRQGASCEDWEAYYDVYLETVARWEAAGQSVTSIYEADVFEALREAPGVRLWVAEHAGEMIAGAILLYASRTAAYWSGAFREAAAPLRPSNVLLGEAMISAAADGLDWLDLGDSGIHERVADFKRRFGAVRRPFGILTRTPARMRAITKLGPLYGAIRRV